MRCFRFIAAERAHYPISLMCRVLDVSRSGFHAWEQRGPSNRSLPDADEYEVGLLDAFDARISRADGHFSDTAD